MTKSNGTQFSNIYVFGDSYSDTGNSHYVTEGKIGETQGKGRFCNDYIWIDYFACQLGLRLDNCVAEGDISESINFAFGGATTGTKNLFPEVVPNLPELPGLQQQISLFTQEKREVTNALYIIWVGAADYAPFVNGIPQHTEANQTISNIAKAIRVLGEVGARNILLMNVPDISKTPLANAVKVITSPSQVSKTIELHNQGLKQISKQISKQMEFQAELNIIHFDVKALVDTMIAYPEKFGFTNTTKACSQIPGSNPDDYIFWDVVHFTSKANQILANAVLEQVKIVM
jgi:phospholipase/lecithinase/hemolysin